MTALIKRALLVNLVTKTSPELIFVVQHVQSTCEFGSVVLGPNEEGPFSHANLCLDSMNLVYRIPKSAFSHKSSATS